jgi:hypothetical protein
MAGLVAGNSASMDARAVPGVHYGGDRAAVGEGEAVPISVQHPVHADRGVSHRSVGADGRGSTPCFVPFLLLYRCFIPSCQESSEPSVHNLLQLIGVAALATACATFRCDFVCFFFFFFWWEDCKNEVGSLWVNGTGTSKTSHGRCAL